MSKAVVLLTLGVASIFVQAQSINCPTDDENSKSTYFPHETQCGLFYECVAGKATLLYCPEGLYWNQRLSVCDWDVDCGSLLTSTASTAPSTSTTTATDTTTEEITTDTPSTTDDPPTTDAPPATDAPDTPDS